MQMLQKRLWFSVFGTTTSHFAQKKDRSDIQRYTKMGFAKDLMRQWLENRFFG